MFERAAKTLKRAAKTERFIHVTVRIESKWYSFLSLFFEDQNISAKTGYSRAS